MTVLTVFPAQRDLDVITLADSAFVAEVKLADPEAPRCSVRWHDTSSRRVQCWLPPTSTVDAKGRVKYDKVCWVHAWRDWCWANAKKFTLADLTYWFENERLGQWLVGHDFRPPFVDLAHILQRWTPRVVKFGGIDCQVLQEENRRAGFEATTEFQEWLRRFDREWSKFPIKVEDADLARWLKDYSQVTKRENVVARYGEAAAASAVPVDEEYRVYKKFDKPHFHKTVRHSGELHETGNERYFKKSSGWGAEVPRPGEPIDWEESIRWEEAEKSDREKAEEAARESQLTHRLSNEEGPAEFTPIRPGVVDPIWGDRPDPTPHRWSWSNFKCFSAPALTVRGVPGGDGCASARPANLHVGNPKIKEFKPAELPSESMLEFWNNKLNAEADNQPVGERSILRQDIYGNLSGFKPYEKRTTQPPPQQKELDKTMSETYVARNQQTKAFKKAKGHFAKLGDGADPRTVAHELVKNSPEAIPLITRFGGSTREVGTIIGKNREAVKKMIQRKDRKIPGLVDMVVRMANDKDAVGTYVAVKLRSRPVYMYKLDVKEGHTADELDGAIEKGWRAEAGRMIDEEARRSGMPKVRRPDGTDTEWTQSIRQRVYRAFQRKPTFTFTWEED